MITHQTEPQTGPREPETVHEYAARIKARDDAQDHAWTSGDLITLAGRALPEPTAQECRQCGQPMTGLETIQSGLLGPLCPRHLRLALQTIRQTTDGG